MNANRIHRGILLLASLALIATLALGGGCASGVEPISIHDPNVPAEGRKLIADAEDSVAIARAKRDEARMQLRQIEAWRQQVRSQGDWPSDATAAVTSLNDLVDSRVRLAQLRRDRAQEQVRLAEVELDLITARVAVRNDLAVYDIEGIHERVTERREINRELDRELAMHMERVDEVTQNWWNTYASYVSQGGDASPFYPAFDRPTL